MQPPFEGIRPFLRFRLNMLHANAAQLLKVAVPYQFRISLEHHRFRNATGLLVEQHLQCGEMNWIGGMND